MSGEPEQRPRHVYNDARDDYDDEFGRVLDPREAARRMVLGPAIAFQVIGVIGILGMTVAEVALLFENLERALNGNTTRVVNLIVGTFFILLAMFLFALVIAAGNNMSCLRRRWLALFGAYVVTGLALAGCYAILFFPFGIWGLVVLYRPDVRDEFRRKPVRPRDDD